MKDAFGRRIWLDDRVAFNPPSYKGLVVGRVTGFTTKSVRVLWADHLDRGRETPRLSTDVVVDLAARRTEMTRFPAGQKVHCVVGGKKHLLTEGAVYTISPPTRYREEDGMCEVQELPGCFYQTWRFEAAE